MAGASVELMQGLVPVKQDQGKGQGKGKSQGEDGDAPFGSLLKSLSSGGAKTSKTAKAGEADPAAKAGTEGDAATAAKGEGGDSLGSLLAALGGGAKLPVEGQGVPAATAPNTSEAGEAVVQANAPGTGEAGVNALAGAGLALASGNIEAGDLAVANAVAGGADQGTFEALAKSQGGKSAVMVGGAAQGTTQGTAPAVQPAAAAGQTAVAAKPAANEAANPFQAFAVESPEEVTSALHPGSDAEGAGAEERLTKQIVGTMKVVRQETHFAPSMRLSPVQQIGEQIVASLKDVPAPKAFEVPTRLEGPILKTLEIQLQPVELGSVKVQLRMVGENVEVLVQAAKESTAELLKRDQQLLDQMLKATGYKPDTITIQTADHRMTGFGNTSQAGADAGGQQAGAGANGAQAGTGDQASGQNPGGLPFGENQGSQSQQPGGEKTFLESVRSDGHEDDADRRDGGVYL